MFLIIKSRKNRPSPYQRIRFLIYKGEIIKRAREILIDGNNENSKMFLEIEKMGANAGNFRPHKALLLLAVLDLFEQGTLQSAHIFYNDSLKAAFTSRFKQFASENDRDRSYAPFFHLRSQSFWSLTPCEGMETVLEKTPTVGGPGQLMEIVKNAVLSEEMLSLLTTPARRETLKSFLITHLSSAGRKQAHSEAAISVKHDSNIPVNPFVSYINSLHSLDGNSDGALAEKQAQEAYFCQIQVEHPLVNEIHSIPVLEKAINCSCLRSSLRQGRKIL